MQSESESERIVFIEMPPKRKLPPYLVLNAMKPFYRITERNRHWDLTYLYQYLKELHMTLLRTDPCDR